MKSRSQWIATMVGCGLVGSIVGTVGMSFADNLASTSSVLDEGVIIPYDGYLMLDSTPVNATGQTLRFALFESAAGGTAQWVETHLVTVNNGRFSVPLGKGTKLSSVPANATFNEVILDAEKLYIGIEVEDTSNPGTYIALAGRQAIEAAPFAAWAATSADFNVERNLQVANNAQINGQLGVSGNVNVGGSVNAAFVSTTGSANVGGDDFALGTGNVRGRGNGGRALVQGTSDTLIVNYANDFTGGTLVQSNMSVTGTAQISQLLTASRGISLGNDQDITGADEIRGSNDLRLYGDPNGGGSGDLFISASGSVSIPGSLSVGSLNAWPSGSYCILRNGPSCPAGFSAGTAYTDAEDSNNSSSTSGSIGASNNNSNGLTLQFCCK